MKPLVPSDSRVAPLPYQETYSPLDISEQNGRSKPVKHMTIREKYAIHNLKWAKNILDNAAYLQPRMEFHNRSTHTSGVIGRAISNKKNARKRDRREDRRKVRRIPTTLPIRALHTSSCASDELVLGYATRLLRFSSSFRIALA